MRRNLSRQLAGVAILTVSVAWGAETRVTREQLPAAVRKTADEQSQNAAVRGYSKDTEDGRLEYEVAMTINGHGKDVTIAPDGRLLEIEEEVSLESLSPNVRSGLDAKRKGATITKVESITKQGVLVAYEAQIVQGGKRREIQVGPAGNSPAHEE